MLRIGFYLNDFNTLGHTTIVFALVKALKNSFKGKVKIKVFQDGNKQGFFPLQRYAQVVPLPHSGLDSLLTPQAYNKVVFKKRLVCLQEGLTALKPDLFITEYLPFSRRFLEYELRYWLFHIKEKYASRLICSCTYPNAQKHTAELLRDFYDVLLFHFPQDFLPDSYGYISAQGKDALRKICQEFKQRIFFTGFILDKSSVSSAERPVHLPQGRFVLVSRGGRLEHKRVLASSILAAKKRADLKFIISCGPFISQKEFQELRILSKTCPNVRLVKYIPPGEFEAHLKKCSLSVNMSGYNTIARLLYLGKRSVIIPFNNNEQEWFAAQASKYIPCDIMQAKDCTASLLERSISRLLESPQPRVALNQAWFRGIENTMEVIKGWS